MGSRPRRRIGDLYSVSPWLDWLVAGGLLGLLASLGVGHLDEFSETAVAVSTVSGIFAAVAVFACGAAFQSEALILRIARAALPGAMRRSWVSIVLGLAVAAALPVGALFLGQDLHRTAELLVLGAALLNVVLMVRVGWWVRFIAGAQEDDAMSRHETRAPDWMKTHSNR